MRGLEQGKSPEAVRHLSVREISLEEARSILSKHNPRLSDDVQGQQEETTWTQEHLHTGAKNRSKRAFLLEWEGVSIPRGADIGDKTIGNMRQGRVFFVQNTDTLGVYERIVQSGGESREEQKIIVFLY